MSTTTAQPRGVHLVGSFPRGYKTSQAFQTACDALPTGYLHTLSDGECEPTKRWNFMAFQYEVFPQEILATGWGASGRDVAASEVQKFVDEMEDIHTGYDNFAIQSYQIFRDLKDQGSIPKSTKFQVSLPSPVTCIKLIDPTYQAAIEPKYLDAMQRALDRIQQEIPHHELAIQWDAAADVGLIEGVPFMGKSYWNDSASRDEIRQGVVDRLARWSNAVDDDVEVGFHLCYGDMDHKHWKEPENTEVLVEIAAGILGQSRRSINWFHMPVPKDRDDIAYFKPLTRLDGIRKEDPVTGLMLPYLFLGLVHAHDEEGTRRRIATASKIIKNGFGVASECGFGRTSDEDVSSVLNIAAKVAGPY